jgi:hypothetical protein
MRSHTLIPPRGAVRFFSPFDIEGPFGWARDRLDDERVDQQIDTRSGSR